jgi:hypothetical protein
MSEENEKHYTLYLKQFSNSTNEEKDFIRPHLSIEKYDKGDFFLK